MTATLEVRPAVPEDAGGVAACHVACWREAYAHLLSPGFLAAMDVAERTALWQGRLESTSGHTFHVGLLGGEVVGFAVAGPADDDRPVRDLALFAIYIRAAHYGSGLGQALLDASVGDRPCQLWVAQDQPRAIAFYSRNGFAQDGTGRVEEHWEMMKIIRMVR